MIIDPELVNAKVDGNKNLHNMSAYYKLSIMFRSESYDCVVATSSPNGVTEIMVQDILCTYYKMIIPSCEVKYHQAPVGKDVFLRSAEKYPILFRTSLN